MERVRWQLCVLPGAMTAHGIGTHSRPRFAPKSDMHISRHSSTSTSERTQGRIKTSGHKRTSCCDLSLKSRTCTSTIHTQCINQQIQLSLMLFSCGSMIVPPPSFKRMSRFRGLLGMTAEHGCECALQAGARPRVDTICRRCCSWSIALLRSCLFSVLDGPRHLTNQKEVTDHDSWCHSCGARTLKNHVIQNIHSSHVC